MARTNDVWETGSGGTFIQTIAPAGYDVLINGSNHYINFNSIVGSSGYGIRDNSGTMEFKNSSGSWTAMGSGGGGSGTVTSVASADGSIGITNPTTTVDLAVVSAPKLTTTRAIYGSNFDGTAAITGPIAGTYGGTGVNNGSKTFTYLKNISFTSADDTGVYTLPTGTKTLVATDVATLSSLVSIGTITTGTWTATKIGLAYGGTNADLSATGGTSNVLKQSSSGAAITVGPLAASDLSNGTTGSGGGVVLATGPTMTNPVVGTQAATDNSTKAASTAYVTTGIANAIAGVDPAVAVSYATTAAGDTSAMTYNNGVSGIGATMTGAVNTAIVIDGHTFVVGDVGVTRILIKNDTQNPSGAFNGVYLFTALQTVGTGAIFTRALDYDTSSDINNTGAIPVLSGTTNALTSWLLNTTITNVGTDPITYTQFSFNPSRIVPANLGGTGIANNAASTITISGSFGTTFTVGGTTSVTLPTAGTLATLAGSEAFTNKDLTGAGNTFPTFNQNTSGSAATLTTTRTIWGQNFNGSGNVSGSLTAVTNITGGASNMTITAGTGNSRTLSLQSTTSGGTATTFLTGDASQNVTLAGNLTLGAGASTITGAAGNMTIVAGTGNSRTLILQTTTSGGTATTALTLNADQTATFAAGATIGGTLALSSNSITMSGSIGVTGTRVTKIWATDGEFTNMPTQGGTSLSSIFSPIAGSSSIVTIGTVTSGTLGTGAIIAGVTMTLGSDASYDTYYRGASGVLTRLPNGTTGQVYTATTNNVPSWGAVPAAAVAYAYDLDGNRDSEPTTVATINDPDFEYDGNSDVQTKDLPSIDIGGEANFTDNQGIFPLISNQYANYDYVIYISGGITYVRKVSDDSVLTSSVDAAIAIQTALNACIATTGGNILIQDGTYTITSPLVIQTSNTRIYGKGLNTVLACNGANVPQLIKFYGTSVQSAIIKGLKLNNTNGTNGVGLLVNDTPFGSFEDITISNFSSGLQIIDSTNTTFYNTFKDFHIITCATCVDIAPSGNPVNDNTFIKFRTLANDNGYGLRIRGGSNSDIFVGFEAEPNTTTGTTGISIEAASYGHSFTGLYCEGNATGILIASGCQANTFMGGSVLGNTADITDNGNQNFFINLNRTSDIFSQFVVPFSIVDQTGNSSQLLVKNNTNFAHVSAQLMQIQLLNGTDTSANLLLANAGTGPYLQADAKWTLGNAGTFTKYNSITTAGLGVAYIVGSYSQTGKSGAVSNAINYTPPATAGRYRISGVVNMISWTTPATFTVVVTYKDDNGTARTETLTVSRGSTGATVAAITAVDRWYFEIPLLAINNGATAITVSTSGTFTGTPSYNLSVVLEQLA